MSGVAPRTATSKSIRLKVARTLLWRAPHQSLSLLPVGQSVGLRRESAQLSTAQFVPRLICSRFQRTPCDLVPCAHSWLAAFEVRAYTAPSNRKPAPPQEYGRPQAPNQRALSSCDA